MMVFNTTTCILISEADQFLPSSFREWSYRAKKRKPTTQTDMAKNKIQGYVEPAERIEHHSMHVLYVTYIHCVKLDKLVVFRNCTFTQFLIVKQLNHL